MRDCPVAEYRGGLDLQSAEANSFEKAGRVCWTCMIRPGAFAPEERANQIFLESAEGKGRYANMRTLRRPN